MAYLCYVYIRLRRNIQLQTRRHVEWFVLSPRKASQCLSSHKSLKKKKRGGGILFSSTALPDSFVSKGREEEREKEAVNILLHKVV